MQKLENGLLSNVYIGCFDHMINGIDPKIHEKAYVGEHNFIGFAESEFAGKYMDICVQFYKYTKDERILAYAVGVANSVVENQREDGYIGGYVKGKEWGEFSVWNQAFTVFGLISVYEETDEKKYFAAAEKTLTFIAEHYLAGLDDILDTQNSGSQHLAILIPAAKLYAMTKNAVYRDFVEHIFERMRYSDNNFTEFESILDLRSKKAIENLCGLIGMAMYSDNVGDEKILGAVKKYWQELADQQIGETGNGTNGEGWYDGAKTPRFIPYEKAPNENCVAVGFAELSAVLFKTEPHSKYLDAIEKTLFNHLLGSLDPEYSDFAYYQPNFGKRITHTKPTAYKCCRYRGFSAISNLAHNLFYENGGCVIPMIYTNASFENANIKIKEETNYPFDGKINFTFSGKGTVKLRIPAWCKHFTLSKNGEKLDTGAVINGFITLSGDWQEEGFTLDLCAEISVRHAEIYGDGYCQLSYGCVLLALNCECEDKEIYISREDEVYFTKIDISKPLERVKSDGYNLEFSAEGEVYGLPAKIQITDYASAAKKSKNDKYMTWIRKI